MAEEAERRGDVLDPYVLQKARKAGFADDIQTTSLETSRQTVPVRMRDASMDYPVRFGDDKGETFNVPYGDRAKIQINNAKAVLDPVGGGVGFYQVPPSSQPGFVRRYGIITSSGGSGALQSGMFTIGEENAGTPVVFTQESGGKKFAPGVDVSKANDVLLHPEKYSRQGAEAYGGTVQLLDNRVLPENVQMGRYPAKAGNLANLVDPFGVNQSKRNFSDVPWQTQFAGAPVIQTINKQGQLSPVTPEGMASIGMSSRTQIADFTIAQAERTAGWGVKTQALPAAKSGFDFGNPLGMRVNAAGQDGATGGIQFDYMAKKPFLSTARKDGLHPTGGFDFSTMVEVDGKKPGWGVLTPEFRDGNTSFIKQSGEIPFIGLAKNINLAEGRIFEPTSVFIPGVSNLLSEFEPLIKVTKTPRPDLAFDKTLPIGDFYDTTPTGGSGAAYTRGFIGDDGKLSDTWKYPKGAPVIGESVAVGKPVVTTRYNPETGETEITTTQNYQQDVMQDYETITLPKTQRVVPITTTFTEDQTPFTMMVQGMMPEKKASTEKSFYLLGDELGPKVAAPVRFASSLLPTSPAWSEQSYENIRKDPLFAAPWIVLSVMLPGAGAIGRSVGLAPLAQSATYKIGSKVAATAMLAFFADYGAKEITGTSLLDLASAEYKYTVTGGKSEHPFATLQRQFIGWDKATENANKLELSAVAAYAAYSAADWAGMRVSEIARTRGNTLLEGREFALNSREGFPVNAQITEGDLIESFMQGKLATVNPSKLAKTEWSITGRRFAAEDFPANPQVMAKRGANTNTLFNGDRIVISGETDIFSGADFPYLAKGNVGHSASELDVSFYAPDAVTYFTKPGTGGSGFGITNDILGLGRMPTMYVSGVVEGDYVTVPRNVVNTPTRGMSMNDPLNPRNIAVQDWINTNAPYGKPILVQYGKSEFQFLVRAGSETTTPTRVGYYMDNGMRIPLDRVSFTGKVAPGFEQQPLPTRASNMFGGIPIKPTRYVTPQKSIPYGASALAMSMIPSSQQNTQSSISKSPSMFPSTIPSSQQSTQSSISKSSFMSPSRSIASEILRSMESSKFSQQSVSPSVFTSKYPTTSTSATSVRTPSTSITKSPSISTGRSAVSEPLRSVESSKFLQQSISPSEFSSSFQSSYPSESTISGISKSSSISPSRSVVSETQRITEPSIYSQRTVATSVFPSSFPGSGSDQKPQSMRDFGKFVHDNPVAARGLKEKHWIFGNPVGAERLFATQGQKINPIKAKKFKFKMPRF